MYSLHFHSSLKCSRPKSVPRMCFVYRVGERERGSPFGTRILLEPRVLLVDQETEPASQIFLTLNFKK